MARRPTLTRRVRPRGAVTRARLSVERLGQEYPDATTALEHRDPFQLLVATILSAQTTDERVNMVTPELFRRWPDPASLAGARIEEVQEVIRSTGFYNSKARAIVEMAQDLVAHHGGQVPPRMEDLVTLRGVGRKTANVVLGVAFGIPGFPVDTHVARLCGRLKLTSSTDPEGIEEEICSMVPPEQWTGLSLRLILHGRRVCQARRPRCEVCALNDFCPSAWLFIGPPRPTRAKRTASQPRRNTAARRS